MVLANEEEQPSLSLTHAFTVLRACHAHLDSALCGLCYYTHQKAGWLARKTWQLVKVVVIGEQMSRDGWPNQLGKLGDKSHLVLTALLFIGICVRDLLDAQEES